jgi:hypothetical protein
MMDAAPMLQHRGSSHFAEVLMPRLTLAAAVLLSAVFAMRSPRSQDSFATWERARVRAHLDSAERELRAQPVTGLTASQRAARARALDRLHEYWVRGVFPQNTDFPNERVPYFIDRHGTRCAMAYLIEQSGHQDFVARVAVTSNNARIRALKDDPELIAWLEENGLRVEEAARIQPEYCFSECYPASNGYKTATAFSVGANLVAVGLNVVPLHLSRTLTGVLGIATGVAGMVIGVPTFGEEGGRYIWGTPPPGVQRRTLGLWNAGVGAVSAAFGVYRLARKPASASNASLALWVGANGAPGLSGRITF